MRTVLLVSDQVFEPHVDLVVHVSHEGLDRLNQLPAVPDTPSETPADVVSDGSWVDADPVLSASTTWEQKEQYRSQVEPLFVTLFEKYAQLGSDGSMRTEDVRKYVKLLFGQYGLAEFDRHFMTAERKQVSKEEFLDFVFTESLVPETKRERDELDSKLRDVANWPLATFKVVSDARVRSTPELGGGVVLGLLQPGDEVKAMEVRSVRQGPQLRQRIGFIMNGQTAWTSELSKDGKRLLEEISSGETLALAIDDVDDRPAAAGPAW